MPSFLDSKWQRRHQGSNKERTAKRWHPLCLVAISWLSVVRSMWALVLSEKSHVSRHVRKKKKKKSELWLNPDAPHGIKSSITFANSSWVKPLSFRGDAGTFRQFKARIHKTLHGTLASTYLPTVVSLRLPYSLVHAVISHLGHCNVNVTTTERAAYVLVCCTETCTVKLFAEIKY